MDDAIRKLDNTRVGDRGENLIRVYKVCSGVSVLCLLRCRVALSGGWLRSSAEWGRHLWPNGTGGVSGVDSSAPPHNLFTCFAGG
jgi:hypothetical protein